MIFVGVFIFSFANILAADQIERKPDVATILLDTVLQLARTRPLTLQQIEKSLHVRGAEDTQRANEYTHFYSATAKDSPVGFKSVEVRFPTAAAATQQRMMVLVLNSSFAPTTLQIRKRLGEPDALQVGRPANPEGTTYTYRIKAGELRFGILREPGERIRTITVVWEE